MKAKGRPKEYENKEKVCFSAYIPPNFQDLFEKFTELSKIDLNTEFQDYCSKIEGIEDISKLGQSKLSLYTRWVIARHVLKNMYRLSKIK